MEVEMKMVEIEELKIQLRAREEELINMQHRAKEIDSRLYSYQAHYAVCKKNLEAEREVRAKAERSKEWYKCRVDMLQKEQTRMRDPERTIVCDILANAQLLPDEERYKVKE
jgi:hypothetical protein